MEIDTGTFEAIRAAAEVTTAQVRAVHARGYEAGHRAARRRLWPLIMLLLALIAAQAVRNSGLLAIQFQIVRGDKTPTEPACDVIQHG